MKIKKKIVVLLAGFLLIIFISSCKKIIRADEPTIVSKDIYKGTEGIVMGFLENAPPDSVFEKGYASVGLKLENNGAYEVKGGYLAISLEKSYMEAVRSSLKSTSRHIDFTDYEHIIFNLKGKSIEAPNGEQDILTFLIATKELEKLSQTHKSIIAVTACYKYKTIATETVCIDPDIYDLKKRIKSCTVKDINLNDQGAPVAVERIETKMLPEENGVKPQFVITVNNKGNGLVISKESIRDACYSKALDYSKLNKIELNAYLIKGGDKIKLDCNIDEKKETAEITLKENKATVRCNYDEGIGEEMGVYSTPLNIEIEYGYTSTISKDIEIKKIVG